MKLSVASDYGDEVMKIKTFCGATAAHVYHEILNNSKEYKRYKTSVDIWAQQWQKYLVTKIGKSLRTIKYAIKKLVENGYLRVQRFLAHKGNQSNFYQISQSVTQRQPITQQSDACKPAESYRVQFFAPSLIINTNLKVNNIYKGLLGKKRSSPPKYIFEQMREWNETFPDHPVLPKYAKYLHAKVGKFLEDPTAWGIYLKKLAAIPFFRSPGFNLRMDSVCSASFREKVEAGTFDRPKKGLVKEEGVTVHYFTPEEICTSIDALNEHKSLKDVRHALAKVIGMPDYISWFHQGKYAIKGEKITVTAPNNWVADQWENRYRQIIAARDDLEFTLMSYKLKAHLSTESVDNSMDN